MVGVFRGHLLYRGAHYFLPDIIPHHQGDLARPAGLTTIHP
jgi:hypothetical protein